MEAARGGGSLILFVGSIYSYIVLIYKIIDAYIEAAVRLFRRPKRKSIAGQNVLITGAGHGLGREMALQLAKEGANLILVDINTANNEQVKQELLTASACQHKSRKLKVLAYTVDIRVESNVADLAARVSRDLDGDDVDILINNAGIVQCLPFLELEPHLIERTFQVNTLAHIWTIKHFLPAMIKRQRGHIVAISSIAGIIGAKYLADYCASKFAVVGLMDSLEREIHDRNANENIHLTTVCPTCMSTGMFQTFTSRFSWLLPVLRADEVASAAVDAILLNKPFIAVPPITLFLQRISAIVPTKVIGLVQDFLDYGVKPHVK